MVENPSTNKQDAVRSLVRRIALLILKPCIMFTFWRVMMVHRMWDLRRISKQE